MAKGKLGFGCMRLPTTDGTQPNIDYAQFEKMVDLFLERGFTYFDTSYVYHAQNSEPALGKELVARHPRDTYTIATKLPTFNVHSEDDPLKFFNEQLGRLGTDYVDFYLLHTLRQNIYFDQMQPNHVFETMLKQREAGRIKHLGFSFHDSPELLDRILTDHPEVEFVQIIINYFDWDSRWINSRECYETIRKNGKNVVIMEPIKGGFLVDPPAPNAIAKMREMHPDWSIPSWALRFANSLDGVIAVLSGMSTLQQMDENTTFMQDVEPLTDEERELCLEAGREARANGPLGTADFDRFVSGERGELVAGMLDAYNAAILQGDKFPAEQNYYRNHLIRLGLPADKSWIDGTVTDRDGNDITDQVKKAESWLLDHLL
jgi:predicted aldo/keto reductase-like oxidoreductase